MVGNFGNLVEWVWRGALPTRQTGCPIFPDYVLIRRSGCTPRLVLPDSSIRRRVRSHYRDRGGLKYVHKADRYEPGGHLLGPGAAHGHRSSVVDQALGSNSEPGHVDLVVVHSYGGGVAHAARTHPGRLLQRGLEGAGPAPAGFERVVDSLR